MAVRKFLVGIIHNFLEMFGLVVSKSHDHLSSSVIIQRILTLNMYRFNILIDYHKNIISNMYRFNIVQITHYHSKTEMK